MQQENYINFDEQKKFVFKKAYETSAGTIPEGTEIILFRGWVYVNGGMADEYSKGLIMSLVNNKQKRNEYLQQMKIIGNKI